jgi:hypothetical protein
MNSLTLWIPHVRCHSLLNDDFLVYSDSVFADNLWIISDIAFLTIRCVNHYSNFAIDLMCQSWFHGRYGFHTLTVTMFSGMISWSTVTQFSLTIYGSAVTYRFSQFHASSMTLFLLSIWCVGREFIDAVDSKRQLSLSFQWWFQGLQGLCFRWWLMDKPWHKVL